VTPESPISRILSSRETGSAVIPLGPTLPSASSDLPGGGSDLLSRQKAEDGTGDPQSATLFGLAPHGVYRASHRHRWSGALLPHPFTLTRAPEGPGGLLSVALSVASPRLAVSEHAARRSSDFPPPCPKAEQRPPWSSPAPLAILRLSVD